MRNEIFGLTLCATLFALSFSAIRRQFLPVGVPSLVSEVP
jgi:hypothetical protein